MKNRDCLFYNQTEQFDRRIKDNHRQSHAQQTFLCFLDLLLTWQMELHDESCQHFSESFVRVLNLQRNQAHAQDEYVI